MIKNQLNTVEDNVAAAEFTTARMSALIARSTDRDILALEKNDDLGEDILREGFKRRGGGS